MFLTISFGVGGNEAPPSCSSCSVLAKLLPRCREGFSVLCAVRTGSEGVSGLLPYGLQLHPCAQSFKLESPQFKLPFVSDLFCAVCTAGFTLGPAFR